MRITICSSIEFTPEIIEIKKELEQKGHKVNIPYITEKIMKGEASYEDFMRAKEKDGDIVIRRKEPVDMIKRYFSLINKSDAILVLNLKKKDTEDYIGGNTLMEIGFAHVLGKKIFLYSPIPKRSERMHYVDEILAMKPIIINRDLSRIS